jgi:tetratricopeptide (TPR) repeat protein
MSARIDTLKSLIAQDPANSRFRYMLAIELINGGDLEGGAAAFAELMAADPNYAAAYFHGGQALEKLGRIEEARAVYRNGIEATTRSGDLHTRSELQGALDLLG